MTRSPLLVTYPLLRLESLLKLGGVGGQRRQFTEVQGKGFASMGTTMQNWTISSRWTWSTPPFSVAMFATQAFGAGAPARSRGLPKPRVKNSWFLYYKAITSACEAFLTHHLDEGVDQMRVPLASVAFGLYPR